MTTSDDFCCFYAIEFEDDSVEAQMLHRGSREDCENVADLIPAVSVSGEKRPRSARVCVRSWDDFQSLLKEGGQ